ncbi:MAG: hypothetical protein QOK35_3050 [Pseudonocardiales bacterium]|nr:hypothetical protein [Pseudonocardiales bacterium]
MTAQPLSPPAPSVRDLPTPSPVPRRRWGRALGILIAVLVVLGGLGAGALYLFGTRTVEPGSVQREIVRITESAVQVTPVDVRCPEGIAMQAGGTFTCTALVDSDAVTYWVHQNDDRGDLTITFDRLLRLDALERTVADKLTSDRGVAVTVDCGPTGRTAVRNTPGQEIDCTASPTSDPTGGTALTATVDANGAVSYAF